MTLFHPNSLRRLVYWHTTPPLWWLPSKNFMSIWRGPNLCGLRRLLRKKWEMKDLVKAGSVMRLEPETALLSGQNALWNGVNLLLGWVSQPLNVSEMCFTLLLIHAPNVCKLERGIFSSSRRGGISLGLNAMSNPQIGPFIGLRRVIVSDKKPKSEKSAGYPFLGSSNIGFVIPNWFSQGGGSGAVLESATGQLMTGKVTPSR